ncbi:threonine/homoserine/homoserine lactone efflux protein [Paenibacillus taihuensis]|uniref:Threonine/homoserine/homoserine lactone efflux protein n=1 Tax=Paenibacillus taihuensis TaxID=1156355 RepID=A0A3D9RWM0_9BACL|nr:LysE family transporter [Paenibacillus taihuensis]REE84393.1 threonine/homoserine/homoserine lactone efflux protein [Paenibacillus taihuensis]
MLVWKGILIGLSIAAPVGPIGVLCMKRTINQGRLYGFFAGLGAATADGLYGLIAAFGFDLITSGLLAQRFWMSLIGGLFLCYLGVQSIRSNAAPNAEAGMSRNTAAAYLTTFLLTITNPMTILSFLGIFAGLQVTGATTADSVLLVVGVFTGSMLWWLFLSIVIGAFRTTLSGGAMMWINRLSGLVLLGFGIFSLWQVIK